LFKTWKVNPDWFFFNKGEMFIEEASAAGNDQGNAPANPSNPANESFQKIDKHVMAIHVLEKRAQVGYAMEMANPCYLENIPKIYLPREMGDHGTYIAFEVVDDSMDDNKRHAVCDRDVVLAAIIDKDELGNKFQIGNCIFLIISQNGCLIRQITDHNRETGDITCHSYNSSYTDFVINLKEVYQLLRVNKVVDRVVKI
jgi:hypothetical protein